MNQRDAYVEKMKAKLDEWNADIEVLEAKARNARAEARARFEAQVRDMRKQRNDFEEKLQEVRHGGDAALDELRRGLDQAATTLGDSVKRARDEILH